jgi:hypothetical protein
MAILFADSVYSEIPFILAGGLGYLLSGIIHFQYKKG